MRYAFAIFTVLSISMLAAQVFAQHNEDYQIWGNSSGVPEVWYEKPEDESVNYGIIKHYNQDTTVTKTHEEFVFDTPYGIVTALLIRTYNIDCAPLKCPDIVRILDTPVDVVAFPREVETDEEQFSTITLFQYIGG